MLLSSRHSSALHRLCTFWALVNTSWTTHLSAFCQYERSSLSASYAEGLPRIGSETSGSYLPSINKFGLTKKAWKKWPRFVSPICCDGYIALILSHGYSPWLHLKLSDIGFGGGVRNAVFLLSLTQRIAVSPLWGQSTLLHFSPDNFYVP